MEKCSSVSWCTEIPQVRLKYRWAINKFSELGLKTGDHLDSVLFSSKTNEDTKMCLRLFPNGKYSSAYLSLFLIPKSSSGASAMYTFSIINSKKQNVLVWESGDYEEFTSGTEDSESSYGTEFFIKRAFLLQDNKELFLPDDCLTICCDVTIANGDHRIHRVSDCEFPEKNISSNLGQLLLDKQEFCDAILCVKGRFLYAHKAILAAKSPVFSTIFKKDVKPQEGRRCLVEMADTSYVAVAQMLRFIYTGKMPDLAVMEDMVAPQRHSRYLIAKNLLVIAIKYQLGDLLLSCEEMLSSSLRIETAAEMFIFADSHNVPSLKRKTVHFIKRNKKRVKMTNGWKTNSQNHASVMLQALF